MVYDINGNPISPVYDIDGNAVSVVYDVDGNPLTSGGYIRGTVYPFSGMSLSDPESVTAVSSIVKNGESSIAYTPTVGGDVTTDINDYEKITFTCNIPVNGQDFGLWLFIDPDSVPCYGGKTKLGNGFFCYRIALNGNNSWSIQRDIKVGWSFHYIKNSGINTITSIGFCGINGGSFTTPATVVLDSVEVGFSCRRAHVMFNLDCAPTSFWDVGYPLFEEYGLPCTLHYPISSTTAAVGADSDYLDLTKHAELKAKGYEFATYSGWQSVENYGESVPFYDDATKTALFEAHAERMWCVNNDSDIFAPSCIHSTGFLFGPVYLRACLDYDFLMIRQGASQNGNGATFTYFDPDYRCMIPYFAQNAWTASATKINDLKSRIDYAVQTKQTLQIGFHAIKDNSYTPVSNDIYIGVDAVEELLSYVKDYQDNGQLICCTTADYVKEVSPDFYNEWHAQREVTT